MRTTAFPRAAAALAAGALLLGLAACGDDDDAGDAADTGDDTEEATIVATDNAFQDGTLTVAAGAEVVLSNTGSNSHTVTADDGAFDTGTVQGGAEGELVAPEEPGTYPFHCEIHPAAMQGTLTVS